MCGSQRALPAQRDGFKSSCFWPHLFGFRRSAPAVPMECLFEYSSETIMTNLFIVQCSWRAKLVWMQRFDRRRFLERTLSESCPSARDTASVEIIEFRRGVAPSSARQCGFFSWEALGECQDCLLLSECRASETSSAIGRSNPCTPSDKASAELGLFAQRQIQQKTLSCTILALH